MLSITYLSVASPDLTPDGLERLVAQARSRNRALGITGVLVHSDGTFVQTLEGPSAAVHQVFAAIVADERHHEVIEVMRETVLHRRFSRWRMAYRQLDGSEVESVPELYDVLRTPADALAEDHGLSPGVLLRLVNDGTEQPA